MNQSGYCAVRMRAVCAALVGGIALVVGVAQAAKPEALK